MSNNYQQGELVVDSISIVNPEKESVDILNLTTNITIFEAINTPFISGRISVIDGLEIDNIYKLMGQESLTIKVRQREGVDEELSLPQFSIDKTFRIYSITDMETINDTTKAYVIHFTDPKWFTCQNTKINQCLRGSYSDMLLKVLYENAGFKDSKDPLVIDKWDKSTPGHHQMIVPGWNINRFIDFIVDNSNPESSTTTWQNSMFFYQTLNGGFRFDSFDSMTRREFPVSFDTMARNSSNSEDVDLNAPGVGLNSQILGYKRDQKFNTMIGTTTGAYAAKLITYDPVRKVEEENVYSITEVFARGNDDGHTSKFPIIRTGQPQVDYAADDMISAQASPEIGEAHVDLSPEITYDSFVVNKINMTNCYSDEAKLIDATGDKNIQQTKGQEFRDTGILERNALLSILEQNSVSVSIPFRSDMSVGNMVKLNLPTAEIKDEDSKGDELMDNRYLIAKITTSIDPLKNRGSLLLHAVKDSHGADIKTHTPGKSVSGAEITC
tara:strand:- start:2018 stop:3511 length:1494 start_codon:yes stop_codon:yes gene_type:complete